MSEQNRNLILSFNAVMMEDRAYRWLFGREVNEDIRTVLRWILLLQHKYGKAPTMELRDAVSAVQDVGASVARTYMHDAEERGYAGSKPGDLGNELLWTLKAEAKVKWLRVQSLRPRIAEVVGIQLSDPTNRTAGADLLPPEVYYNIVGDDVFRPEDIRVARERKRKAKQEKMQRKQELIHERTIRCPGAGSAGADRHDAVDCQGG
jgi:hypothetical protein